jgi:hypothetical protein
MAPAFLLLLSIPPTVKAQTACMNCYNAWQLYTSQPSRTAPTICGLEPPEGLTEQRIPLVICGLMEKAETIFVSDGMKRAGGAALSIARGDLFDLLSVECAQEIAVSVYVAMVRRNQDDKCQTPVGAHREQARLGRQSVTSKTRHG